MKKSYILAFLLIAASIVVLLTAADDVSTYSSFEQARITTNKVKIAGKLAKDAEVVYNPEQDANSFSFTMVDPKGESQKVVLLQPKPQDFERSEQVVVTGSMKDEVFVATDVLLKCPSKYKNEELSLRGES